MASTKNKNRQLLNTGLIKKKWFTWSNVFTTVIMIFILTLIFSPDVKAKVIQNLMKIGLFQPEVPKVSENAVPEVQASTPEVSFKDAEGKIIHLSEQKGKVVFINFWATWCPPCIAEMPSIDKLYSQFKDNKNVMFIMVDVDSNFEKSNAFMKKKGYGLPVYTPSSGVPEEYFSGSMPTTVILDKSGSISFHHVGGADYANPKVADYIKQISK